MSAALKFVNALEELPGVQFTYPYSKEYMQKLSRIISDATEKGSDVLQLPNGDICMTEVKVVTYKYCWNEDKNKFERVTSGSKIRKRLRKEENNHSSD